MKLKRLTAVMGVLVLLAVIGVIAAGTALAQADRPAPTPGTSQRSEPWFGRGLDSWGGRWMGNFDAIAKALNLTPTQLFEELHSGKTLDEIAEAQGVDLTEVREAAEAARVQAMRDAIAQAVQDGEMTQEQADWLLQGLDKGFLRKSGRGFGFDFSRGMRGMRGHGMWGPGLSPSTPAPGASS